MTGIFCTFNIPVYLPREKNQLDSSVSHYEHTLPIDWCLSRPDRRTGQGLSLIRWHQWKAGGFSMRLQNRLLLHTEQLFSASTVLLLKTHQHHRLFKLNTKNYRWLHSTIISYFKDVMGLHWQECLPIWARMPTGGRLRLMKPTWRDEFYLGLHTLVSTSLHLKTQHKKGGHQALYTTTL